MFLRRALTILLFLNFHSVPVKAIVKCPKPTPPLNAKITGLHAFRRFKDISHATYGVDDYYEYDEVTFTCKDGYIRAGVLPFFKTMFTTCGSNGKWFPETSFLGHCVPTTELHSCNSTRNLFKCKTSQRCIGSEKRCDCTPDCADGSDEMNCAVRKKVIFASPTSLSNGIITSPGYPRPKNYPRYPNQYDCVYHIATLINHHIRIDFEEFDLPPKESKKCLDFVRIRPIHPKFLSKNKSFARRNLFRNKSRTSQTKCAKNVFKRIYSNTSYITINVSLGHSSKPKKHFKGFSLSWQVTDKGAFFKALDKKTTTLVKKKETPAPTYHNHHPEVKNDSMYTLVLPIALGGVLPMCLLLICVCHRILHHHFKIKKHQLKVNKKAVLTMTLTENNLAKLDQQQKTTISVCNTEGGPHTGLLKTNAMHENKSQRNSLSAPSKASQNRNSKPTPFLMDPHASLPQNTLQQRPSPSVRPSHYSSDSVYRHTNNRHHSHSTRSNSCSKNTSSSSRNPHKETCFHPSSASKWRHKNEENIRDSASTQNCFLCHKSRNEYEYETIRNCSYVHPSYSIPLSIEIDSTFPSIHDVSAHVATQETYLTNLPFERSPSNSRYSTDHHQNDHVRMEYSEYGLNEQQNYSSSESITYSSTVPYPLNYEDSDFIAESAFIDTPSSTALMTSAENKGDIFGFYTDGCRGESLICTH